MLFLWWKSELFCVRNVELKVQGTALVLVSMLFIYTIFDVSTIGKHKNIILQTRTKSQIWTTRSQENMIPLMVFRCKILISVNTKNKLIWASHCRKCSTGTYLVPMRFNCNHAGETEVFFLSFHWQNLDLEKQRLQICNLKTIFNTGPHLKEISDFPYKWRKKPCVVTVHDRNGIVACGKSRKTP